jgi:uncharacterized protein (DUF2252 family)
MEPVRKVKDRRQAKAQAIAAGKTGSDSRPAGEAARVEKAARVKERVTKDAGVGNKRMAPLLPEQQYYQHE